MIYLSLLKLINSYCNPLNSINIALQDYLNKRQIKSFEYETLDKNYLLKNITKILLDLGFSNDDIEYFLKQYMNNHNEFYCEKISTTVNDINNTKLIPIFLEIILLKFLDYISNKEESSETILKLTNQKILSINILLRLKDLNILFLKNHKKRRNLYKYMSIQVKLIEILNNYKHNIIDLQKGRNVKLNLQLIYLIYRITEFFNISEKFNFDILKTYLKENLEDYQTTIPLVSLNNPEIYYCGYYLAQKLYIDVDTEKIKTFLAEVYNDWLTEFESPFIQGTRRLYYFLKSLDLFEIPLSVQDLSKLKIGDEKYFESYYISNLETSRLVVILKIFDLLNLREKVGQVNIGKIISEIQKRVNNNRIIQYNDGISNSEAIYYMIFYNYVNNSMDNLKDVNLIEDIVMKIHRNLEILTINEDTNRDLLSELIYSFESLKLLNCIKSKESILHIIKYLFPERIYNEIENLENYSELDCCFPQPIINKKTGEVISKIG